MAADATSSTVENYQGFATNDYAVFGKPGEEKSEIVKLTSVTANVTLGHSTGPVFPHSARTPVSQMKYNQAKIYSASTETGEYSLLDTIDLDVDQEQTVYDDTTGTSITWYKIKYYNATTTTISDYSDAVIGTGYTENSLRSMTDEILDDYGDSSDKEGNRNKIRRYLRAGVRNITREIIKVYPDYRKKYDTQALSDGTATYDLPDRFLTFFRVDVNSTGTSATSAYKAIIESEFEGEPNTSYSTSDPRVFFRSSGNTEQFGIRPTPAASGMAFLWFWDYPATMTDDGDEHGLPYGAREILVSYGLMRLWKPKNADKSAQYKADLKEDLPDFIESVAQQKQTISSREVEPTGVGSDLYEIVE